LTIRVDEISGLELRRSDYDLAGHVLELSDVVAADVLELRVDDARRLPFAVLSERHRADHGVDGLGRLVRPYAFTSFFTGGAGTPIPAKSVQDAKA
jgi:hypothetical protein